MDRLVIALPTRGRPELLLKTLPITLKNIRHPKTQLIVMLDADDGGTIKALSETFGEHADHLIVNIHEREDTIGQKYNRMLHWDADCYMGLPDHSYYTTEGFDEKILEAASRFPDGIGVVFSHMANLSFTYLNAATKKYIDLMGYYYPEYFPFWFVDHWFEDIARIVGRIEFADVVCDSTNKQPTQEMRECGFWATWFDAAFLHRRQIAHKIIDATDWPQQHKEMQKNVHHAWGVERWSRYVNDGVRASNYPSLPITDERYARAKTRAAEMVPELLKDLQPAFAAAYRDYLAPGTLLYPTTTQRFK